MMLLEANESTAVMVWSLALIASILLLFALVTFIKRRLQQPEQSVGFGFSLSELRKMHEQGQLSDEEFARAKSRMLAEAARKNSPKPE